MENLLTIIEENNQQLISGRNLHEFLEVKTEYNKWLGRMIEYGFSENYDFILVSQKRETNNPKNPITEFTDHLLTIDMAKELSMIQRSKKGRQARQYFIEIEKAWNTPEMIMERALKIARENVEKLQLENTQQKLIINEMKPKVDYYDVILQSKELVTITQIAKDYGMSGKELNKILNENKIQYKQSGQWLLYSPYQNKSWTQSETIEVDNHKYGGKKLILNTKWTQKGRLAIHDLLTDLGYKANIDRINDEN